MSVSLLESLSEAQLAKLLEAAGIKNGEAVSEPTKSVSRRTGFMLIRALGNEVADDEVVPVKHGSDEVAYWGDDSPITFGDLRFSVEDGATRADGTKCRDYPNVWLLSQDQAWAALQIANSAKPKPKAQNGGFKPKATAKPSVDAEGIEALIQREIAKAVAGMQLANVPAKPEPAKGYTKSRKAAKAEPAKPVFAPGDVITVMVNGEAVELQITEDAKRLRKTVV